VYLRGKTWRIQYYSRGKAIRESSKSKKKSVAVALLKQRLGDVSQGKLPQVYFEHTTFEDLAELLIADCEEKRALERAQIRVKHIKQSFGGMRAIEITTTKVREYIKNRLDDSQS
jgi:hypothetical protein